MEAGDTAVDDAESVMVDETALPFVGASQVMAGVEVATYSYAPASNAEPCGTVIPARSVVNPVIVVPALMAGDPA
jgi:hypothetical protein